jgi:hypothetical protein
MARLALFSIVLFSLSLSANAASLQQPLAYPDGSVHTAEGWGWSNCGQSVCIVNITHHLTLSLLFKDCPLTLSRLSPLTSPLIRQSLDRT